MKRIHPDFYCRMLKAVTVEAYPSIFELAMSYSAVSYRVSNTTTHEANFGEYNPKRFNSLIKIAIYRAFVKNSSFLGFLLYALRLFHYEHSDLWRC